MKKTFLYRLLSLFMCVVFSTLFINLTGCADEDFTLYFGVDELPNSLDPQKATLYSEKLAVKNCFSGLTKIDENDDVTLCVAESYSVSNDQLTYTFNLAENYWNNEEKVTAHDFVFAIKRACDPQTKANETEKIINIIGAKKLLNGQNAELGVYAENDNTIVFNLESPDSDFLYKLASPIFMPCNEDFFNKSKGKYGLGVDYILTNGKFKVASWSIKSNFVRLNRTSEDNKSLSEVKSVYISMGTSGKDTITRINDSEIGMTLNSTGDISSIDTSKYTIKNTYNKNYVIVFNKETQVGKNSLLTDAFAMSINRENLSLKINNQQKLTESILPENIVLNSKISNNNFSIKKYNYSPTDARTAFLTGLKNANIKKFPQVKALTVNTQSIKSVLTEVIADWQSNLGTYINIETVSNEQKLSERISNKDYTIAFIPINNDVISALNLFKTDAEVGINSKNYDEIVTKLCSTYSNDTQEGLLKQALEIISNDSAIIPIISTPSTAIWSNEYKNVCFNTIDMTVDFSIIHK